VDAAALAAAITCSRPGADPPTRAEVDALLAAQNSASDSTGAGRGQLPTI
jgi:fructokinase